MKRFALHGVVLLLLCSGTALAQSITVSGTQTISAITTATPGSEPDPVTTAAGSTTYNVITGNVKNAIWKISARLTTALPAGLTLALQLTPNGQAGSGTSAGMVTLSTVDQAVITSLQNAKTFNTNKIQYRLSASSAAGQTAAHTCTGCVTFTVTQQ
jgi:hypothetical protein